MNRSGSFQSGTPRPVIILEEVSCRYGPVAVLNRISLTIPAGLVTVIIGPSGSGKTTLLGLMNGMVRPSQGRVLVNGQEVAGANLIALRRQMGYAIQEVGLFPHYTVYENIALVPRLLKWKEEKIRQRVEELCRLMRIPTDRLGAYPHQLSGGQQQRVGVARALAADPDILLMDEPFGALDPITREQLQDEFLALQRRLNKTVVFVTHDMDEALKLGDRLVLLHRGNILQKGHPFEFLLRPRDAFVRAFVGRHRLLTAVRMEQLMPWLPELLTLPDPPGRAVTAGSDHSSRWVWAPRQPGGQPVLWRVEQGELQSVPQKPFTVLPSDTLESVLALLMSQPEALLIVQAQAQGKAAVATLGSLQQALGQLLTQLMRGEGGG